MTITEGLEFDVDTIEWRDPYWDFDHPSAVLAPIFRAKEDGSNHERLVEDVCIDAVVDGGLKGEDFEKTWGWRGYSLSNLRRCFNAALKGKTFPRLGYTARRTRVRIVRDEQGELTWEEVA